MVLGKIRTAIGKEITAQTKTNCKSLFTSNPAKINIPDYLYHITTKDSCKHIFQDGFIKQTHDCILNKDAVFTIDKNNFFKEWSKTYIDNENLKDLLVMHTGGYSGNNVVLKIATRNLKLKNLFVRNQKKFFGLRSGDYEEIPKNPIKFAKVLKDFCHIRFGIPAFMKKFFKSNKPYEYIYKDKIDVENIEQIISLEKFLKA